MNFKKDWNKINKKLKNNYVLTSCFHSYCYKCCSQIFTNANNQTVYKDNIEKYKIVNINKIKNSLG